MPANPVAQAAEASEQINLAALARLATVSFEAKEREYEATIATLKAQTLRYETAIDKISQGVCFFDGEQRLLVSNRRYAEIYRLTPELVSPGTTLRKIAEGRFAVGTCPMDADDYLRLCGEINSGAHPKIWTSELRDGRTIHICHQPMPDGGWVATHEDITEIKASRVVANERVSLQSLVDWVPDYLWVKDTESRFVVANKAIASDSGRTRTSDMIGLTDFDIHAPEAAQEFRALEQDILRSGRPMIDQEEFVIDGWGNEKWLSSTKVPLRNEQNEILGLVGIARDITERKRADVLRDGQAQILEMIAMRAQLEDVLEHLMHLVESQITGAFGSVLLLDDDEVHLRHRAAPSLTKAFVKAIDGVRVGPSAGSFGAAVYRRETVIVKDIMHDPLWEDYRELAAEHGYRSCWSIPILAHQGAALGVFAIYSASVREPTEAEATLIALATHVASIAIELKRVEASPLVGLHAACDRSGDVGGKRERAPVRQTAIGD